MKMLKEFVHEWRWENAAGRVVMAFGVIALLSAVAMIVCALGWIWADAWSSRGWVRGFLTAAVVGVASLLVIRIADDG